MTDPATSSAGVRAFVRFELRGCGNNPARPTQPAEVGTLTLSKDFAVSTSTGSISGVIIRNDQISCAGVTTSNYYQVTIFSNGTAVPGTSQCYRITGATFDLNAATPCATSPVVVAPIGDTTYQRLDGGNQAVGNYVPSATGFNLGAAGARWNGFFDDVIIRKPNNAIVYNSNWHATLAAGYAEASAANSPLYIPPNTTVTQTSTITYNANVPILCGSRQSSVIRVNFAGYLFTGSGTVDNYRIENCKFDGLGVATGLLTVPDYDGVTVNWSTRARHIVDLNQITGFLGDTFHIGRSNFMWSVTRNHFWNNARDWFSDRYSEFRITDNFFDTPRSGSTSSRIKVIGSASDSIIFNSFIPIAGYAAEDIEASTPIDGNEVTVPWMAFNRHGGENENVARKKIKITTASGSRVAYGLHIFGNNFICGYSDNSGAISLESPVGFSTISANFFNGCKKIVNDAQPLATSIANNSNLFTADNTILPAAGYPVTVMVNGGRGFNVPFAPNRSVTDRAKYQPFLFEADEIRNRVIWSEDASGGHWTLNNITLTGGACNQVGPNGFPATGCKFSHATSSADNIQIPIDNTGMGTAFLVGFWAKCGTTCDLMSSITDVTDTGKLHAENYDLLTANWEYYEHFYGGLASGNTFRAYFAPDFASPLTNTGDFYLGFVAVRDHRGPYQKTASAALNDAALGTNFNKSVKFDKGIEENGSGYKHQQFGAGCATAAAAGAVCDSAFTWTAAFADANVTINCTATGLTSGVPTISKVYLKTAAGFTITTAALTAVAAQYAGFDCTATHKK